MSISGSGILPGTVITGQVSGPPGSVGTYMINRAAPALPSQTVSGDYLDLRAGNLIAG